jgi:hypothetical protein
MATDNTPPRLRLIVTIATIVVITLVSLDFVFKSYYAYMTDEAKAEKVAPKTALLAQVTLEKSAFAGAKVPVEQAMKEIASGTRPDLIEPKPSDDLAPMTGWNKLPKQAPIGATVSPAAGALAADAGAGAMIATDGGAPMAADGGATTAPLDAGAPKPIVKDAGAPRR